MPRWLLHSWQDIQIQHKNISLQCFQEIKCTSIQSLHKDNQFFHAPGAKAWISLGSSVTKIWLLVLNTIEYRYSAFQSTIWGCKQKKMMKMITGKKEKTTSQKTARKSWTITHVIILNILDNLFTIIGCHKLESIVSTLSRPLEGNSDEPWSLCNNTLVGLTACIILSLAIHSLRDLTNLVNCKLKSTKTTHFRSHKSRNKK